MGYTTLRLMSLQEAPFTMHMRMIYLTWDYFQSMSETNKTYGIIEERVTICSSHLR